MAIAEANAMPFFNQIAKKKEPVVIVPEKECGKVQVIALGISTGGPNALRELFKNIDPNVKQPILVVQHMPAGFTKEFANSLNKICALEVKEAEEVTVEYCNVLPATAAQMRVYTAQMRKPDSTLYNIPYGFNINIPIYIIFIF